MTWLATIFAVRLMKALVRLTSGTARDWARAMQAEMAGLVGFTALGWVVGCCWALVIEEARALFEHTPRGAMKRNRLYFHTGMLATLCVTIWLVAAPPLRQGMNAVWSGFKAGESDAQLAQTTIVNPSAANFAYAALHSRSNEQRGHWAERAVSLDPGYTWVYLPVLEQNLSSPQGERWLTALKRFDPGNGAIYVVEASRVRHQAGAGLPESQWIARHPEWVALMEVAFQSEHWNSYTDKRLALEIQHWQAAGDALPFSVVFGLITQPLPSLGELATFSRWKSAGSEADVEQNIKFGAVVANGSLTTIERLTGRHMIALGYRELAKREQARDQADAVGRYLALASTFDQYYDWPWSDRFASAARMTQAGVLVLVFCVLAVIVIALLNVWRRLAHKPLRFVWVLPAAAFTASVAATLIQAGYTPFAESLAEWSAYPNAVDKLLPFAYFFRSSTRLGQGLISYCWSFVTLLLSGIALYLIGRQFRRSRSVLVA
jgi:hypothetical protein